MCKHVFLTNRSLHIIFLYIDCDLVWQVDYIIKWEYYENFFDCYFWSFSNLFIWVEVLPVMYICVYLYINYVLLSVHKYVPCTKTLTSIFGLMDSSCFYRVILHCTAKLLTIPYCCTGSCALASVIFNERRCEVWRRLSIRLGWEKYLDFRKLERNDERFRR